MGKSIQVDFLTFPMCKWEFQFNLSYYFKILQIFKCISGATYEKSVTAFWQLGLFYEFLNVKSSIIYVVFQENYMNFV